MFRLLRDVVKTETNTAGTRSLVVCGVLIIAAVNASWMLSSRTLDSHECFVSVTAREMLQSGNWAFPTCNGRPRLNKTPLPYWLVAGVGKITGKIDELTARLPSAFFAFLSAAAILYFVNRWLSFRIAVISASVWATSLGYIRCSHSARPDMALAFFVVLCLSSFYSAVNTENRSEQVIYMLVFWVSFGLGMLAKGPAPVPYVFIPVFLYIAFNRQWKIVYQLLPIAGSIIFLAIVLPWPLFIARKVNWDLTVWKREFFDRLFGDYAAGHFPVYYYLLIMFKYVTPWVAFLPMALAAPFFSVWRNKRPVMMFLWLWFVPGMLFLTIDVCKRQHYILPLMPAMTVLVGILLEDMVFVRRAFSLRYAKSVLRNHVLVIIGGVIAGTVYIAQKRRDILSESIVLGVPTIAIAAAVALLFAKRKPAAALGMVFAGIVAWVMISKACFATMLDVDRHSRDFARKVAQIVPQSDRLVAYRHVSSRFVQYFGKVVPEIQDRSELSRRYRQGDWVVCSSEYLEDLTQDKGLRRIYYRAPIAGEEKEDAGGVLFHRTAPVMENTGNNVPGSKSILPEDG
ncbi:MAG TPA: glycosyltransferase family 39 protein [Sedimentisphaerales bacterium]|nr:glycosyltransferase family 39 protein [Sedimentisphaerales bacterium]